MDVIRRESRPSLRKPVFIVAFGGWNDAGESATTAVRYLARECHAAAFASVDPDSFYDFTVLRPEVRLVDGTHREVDWSTVEFSAAALPGAPRDLILGVGPEPHLRWRAFTKAVLELAREYDATTLVTLGGYLAEVLYSRPVQVTGFSTDAELAARLGVTLPRYEGPTGIVGVLADACRQAAFPAVSLWAALPHYIAASPNPRGALALLIRLAGLLDVHLDFADLEQAAAEFEVKVNEAVANDPKLSAYVRELKKREFVH